MPPQNWNYTKELECLLFFAQRAKEVLFDYTLDTFKAPALNPSSICFEAQQILIDIEEKHLSPQAIKPILKELIWKVKDDPITKSLLGQDLSMYLHFPDENNLKDVRTKVELLHLKISSEKYIIKAQELLFELISLNKEKRKIDKITTNYISSLIEKGYSQHFLYLKFNDIFFHKKVNNIYHIQELFKLFSFKKNQYEVIFKGSKVFKEISDSATTFNISITEKLNPEIELDKKVISEFPLNGSDELYLFVHELKAYDAMSAKMKAYSYINKLSKLFIFFHHKEHPNWSEEAFIISSEGFSLKLKSPISPMKKSKDFTPPKAARKLNETIKLLNLERRSFRRVDRAIDLHGLSVENDNTENQLLQNWIAFETILVGYKATSKINQVITSLIPFLLFDYIERILNYFSRDLTRQYFSETKNLLRDISEGKNAFEKICLVITTDKYKDKRAELYNILDSNPLLKWRLFLFNKYFSDGKGILGFLTLHKTKISWQLKRIYRTRNLIVHTGRVPRFIPALVENSHTYLDILLATIISLRTEGQHIFTIEHAISELKLRTDKYLTLLNNNLDTKITETNFRSMLLNKASH